MPPRLVTWLIVMFWLGSCTWMFVRDVWPRIQPGEPPPYSIDLTDEVSASTIGWRVLHDGKKVGTGESQVRRLPDRTFKMVSQFRGIFGKISLRSSSEYHITAEGKLLAMYVNMATGPVELDLEGKVEGDTLKAKAHLKPLDMDLDLEPIPLNQNTFLNPLHLLNRLPGLRIGQTWRVSSLDLTKALVGSKFFPGNLIPAEVQIAALDARVSADILEWNEDLVPCYKIEYRKPGEEEVKARTWVRRRDGLVLQQEGSHFIQVVIQREPSK